MNDLSKIIVPLSGGKDSQATLIKAMQDGRDVIPVFNETGWEHPITYKHLQYIVNFFNLELVTTFYKDSLVLTDLIRRYKRFPFGRGRFCTDKLKSDAFRDYLKSTQGSFEIWLGIRADESAQRRKKYGELEKEVIEMDELFPSKYPKSVKERCKYRLPVLLNTREEIFQIIKEAGMKYNPLYDQGFDRVGCFPCLISAKKYQEKAFNTDIGKERWKIIKELEVEIGKEYEYDISITEPCKICSI